MVLRRLQEELQWAAARPWAAERDGLSWVWEDWQVLARHIALLPPPEPPDPVRRHFLQGLSLKLRRDGPEALDRRERRELLLDADSIRALADQGFPATRQTDFIRDGEVKEGLT